MQSHHRAQRGRIHECNFCQVDNGHRIVSRADRRLKLVHGLQNEPSAEAKYPDPILGSRRGFDFECDHTQVYNSRRRKKEIY